MESTPSLVTPESKPEAPVLSEPESTQPNTPSSPQTAPPPKPITSIPFEVSAASATKPAPTPAPASATTERASSIPQPSKPTVPIEATANPSPALSIPSEARPVGGRRNKSEDETNGATRGSEMVQGGAGAISNAGLQMPGKLLNDPNEKGALKIKVHLNLAAKVRLDLDAQIYGDVVIGLL